MAALGGLLLWLAQPGTAAQLGLPGASLGWLGWIAPAPWVWLVLRREPFSRRQYTQVWLGGWCYWLLTLHWVCYPHPLTPIGWPFLCAYLALYPMLFVLLTRRIAHRTPAPIWIAAPIVWAMLEFTLAHLFTGFQVGVLSHTQAFYPQVIQISDLSGAYGVSFVLTMVASTVACAFHQDAGRALRTAGVVTALTVVSVTLWYGHLRLSDMTDTRPGPMLAIIQGDTRATWDPDPDRSQRIMDAHTALTQQAADLASEQRIALDLVIWPESMFRVPLVTLDGEVLPPRDMPENSGPLVRSHREWIRGLAATHNASLLVGVDRFDLPAQATSDQTILPTIYNCAAFTNRQGEVIAYYDKTHRVPFGEYIPLAKNMPALYFLTPMSGGLGEGKGPVSMKLQTPGGSVRIATNICYESVIPHVVRRHVAELAAAGESPDLLVNITNDAWFWGASELDMHLACGVFRAVENRRPMAIAANTGLSAVLDGCGRVLHKSHRMQEDVIVAQTPLDGRDSFYSDHGDWFALACLAATVGLIVLPLARKASSC